MRSRVTSLTRIAGKPLDITAALATVSAHLHRLLQRQAEQPFATLLREYDAHHALVGKNVSVLDASDAVAVSGRCEGLDEMGRLLLRSRTQVHRIISGQVQTI